MKKYILKFTLGLILLSSLTVQAEVLFEGYYKVTQFGKHIGFIVQRNELDAKTK
ncbi:MAG: hypothetical protein H7235_09935, partial [Bdellovibrionaceae bacterium]|nr:hypothetical protein [Pseudobdellovibrionaceae bacterium]